MLTPTVAPTVSFQRLAQSAPARSAHSGNTCPTNTSRARAKSASDTLTKVMSRASPMEHSPLPVRQAISVAKASCALDHAASSKLALISALIKPWVSLSRLFHLSMFMAVTTLSQPPNGMGSKWVDTSHQPAEYPDPAPVTAQSTVPFCNAPGTSPKPTLTPSAPNASRNFAVIRPEARIFLPAKSSRPAISALQNTTCGGYG